MNTVPGTVTRAMCTGSPGVQVILPVTTGMTSAGRGTLACAKLTGTGSLQAALAGAGTFESFSPGAVSALMLLLQHLLALALQSTLYRAGQSGGGVLGDVRSIKMLPQTGPGNSGTRTNLNLKLLDGSLLAARGGGEVDLCTDSNASLRASTAAVIATALLATECA